MPGVFENRYVLLNGNEEVIRRIAKVIEDDGERLTLQRLANGWVTFLKRDNVTGLYLFYSSYENGLTKLTLPQHHIKQVMSVYVNEVGLHREDGPALIYTVNNELVKTYALQNIVYSPEEYLEALPEDKRTLMLFHLNELRS